MPNSQNESIIEQISDVVRNGLDYLNSLIALFQARLAEYAFSFILFVYVLVISILLGVAAFIFFNVAFGFWLKNVLGSTSLSVLVMGGIYGFLSLILGAIAFRWVKNLKS